MSRKLLRLVKSFGYAGCGFWHCVRKERNFRIHLVATACVLMLASWLRLDGIKMAILFLAVGTVVCLEMVNTALEALVDLCAPNPHPLAKIVKDVAAGAVLVAAVLSAAVGIALLWQPDKLLRLLDLLLDSPTAFLGLIAFSALAFWFVFGLDKSEKKT